VTKPHYEVVPVGWVESPLVERAQAPRQGDEGTPPAWLAFEAEFAEASRDLRPGTEIIARVRRARGSTAGFRVAKARGEVAATAHYGEARIP
jgi:hypothetical protein